MICILVPGAWAGGWIWDATAAKLRQFGHSVHQLTLPGFGDGEDAGKVTLTAHVNTVIAYLESHKLNDVVLVGHSYSGIVVGQVSALLQHRVAHSVFIEAFLPVEGKSLLDVSGLDVAHEKRLIENNGGLWPAPTLEELKSQPHLSDELIALLGSKQKDHPGKTVTEPAAMAAPLGDLRATFIAEAGWLSSSREADVVQKLRENDNWGFKVLNGGHWPMLTMPDELAVLMHNSRT